MPKINLIENIGLGISGLDNFTKYGGINCVYEKIGTDNQYVRQRSGIIRNTLNPFKDINKIARGYFVNLFSGIDYQVYGDSIYSGRYSILKTANLNLSKSKVYICGLNDFTVFHDVGTNKSYYENGVNGGLVENIELNNIISSIQFGQLARGCPILNGSVYAQLKSGEIYNSDVEDGSKWNSLAFISSERQPDEAYYIDVLGNHIISINSSTIEFFYDNNNKNGSRLSPRLDISIDVGGIDRDCYVKNNNKLYFIGKSGDNFSGLAIFVLENFILTKISNDAIDFFLKNNSGARMYGFNSDGRFFLNLINDDSGFRTFTLTFDSTSGIWTESKYFQDYIVSSESNIMSFDGDLSVPVIGSDYLFARDIDSKSVGPTTFFDIKSSVILENNNFDVNEFKRIKRMSVNSVAAEQDFYVDIAGTTNGIEKFKRKFNINGSVDTKKAQRLGRFKNISLRIDFGGILSNNGSNGSFEFVKIKSIEVDF